MKKTWNKPVIAAEEFVANEYVATCYAYIGTNIVVSTYYPTDGKCLGGSQGTSGNKCNNSWNGKGFEDDGFDNLAGLEDICPTFVNDKGKTQQYSGWYYSPTSGTNNPRFNLGGPYPGHTAGNYGNGAYHGSKKGNQHMASDAYFIKIETITQMNHTQFGVGPNAS